MPKRNKILRTICPLETALDIIGGKWKGIIIYRLLDGKMRFNELRRVIPAITHRMLIRQLRELQNDGLIVRNVQTEGQIKVEYGLSAHGIALKSILLKLRAWGEKIDNIA